MTKFVYYTATSINGFIADESRSLDWLFEVAEEPAGEGPDFMAGVGVQVMGSTTYEWLLDHEELLGHPEKWAGFFGEMSTKVFSSRDLPIPEGADVEILRGEVADHVAALRRSARGKDVWIAGGGDLAGQFLESGHLDRIEVTIAPAFLAGGAPLLPREVSARRLGLVSTEQRGAFAHLVYDVVR